ncbi:MAG: sortase [Firmicutes bacterium]|nr:sortase [Bacillota bacterium]
MIKNVIRIITIILVIELYIGIKQSLFEIKKDYEEKTIINNILDVKKSNLVKIDDKKNYEMIIEIPKINLKKIILSKDDKHNNIDENVTILKESNYPNEFGNIYIAAHSGYGKHSYFNKLTELKINNKINIYYKNIKYVYKVVEIKKITKIETSSIVTKNKNNLILITCSQEDKSKYLVVVSNQIKETELNN